LVHPADGDVTIEDTEATGEALEDDATVVAGGTVNKTSLEDSSTTTTVTTKTSESSTDVKGPDLENFARSTVASMGGEIIANEIGGLAQDGDINKATQLAMHGALGCGVGAVSGGDCASGAVGGVVGEATAMVADELIYDGKTNANSSEGQKKVIEDIGTTAAQVAAGLSGLDADTAALTAGNAIKNNYLTKQEVYQKVVAQKACDNGNASSCKVVDALEEIDKLRDNILHACEGPTANCVALFEGANAAYVSLNGAYGSREDHDKLVQDLNLKGFNDKDIGTLLTAFKDERLSIYGNEYLNYVFNPLRDNSTLDYNAVYNALSENDKARALKIGDIRSFKDRTEDIKTVGEVGLSVTPAGVALDIRDLINAKTPEERALALLAFMPVAGDAGKYIKKVSGTSVAKIEKKIEDVAVNPVSKGATAITGEATSASKATNRTATNTDVAENFQQNRRFWSSEPVQFNGNRVYQRNDLFDPSQTSTWRQGGRDVTGTNLDRMTAGRAPLDSTGNPINLHHMTQSQHGAIAEVNQNFHSKNHGVIHINPNTIPSGINRSQFDTWRGQYWRNRAATYGE